MKKIKPYLIDNQELVKKIIFVLVILLACFLRFYKLTQVPEGLYQDETAIGYNSFSILKTGKDEHGVSYPLYFESFGDYKMPVYIYLTAISIKILGLNFFAVRATSAISGIVAVILIFFLVKKISDWKTAIISSLLLAINPWHFFFSRAALEVNLAVTLFLAGYYCFYKSIKKKNYFLIILSMLLFGLSSYTYNISRFISPIFFLTIFIYFRKQLHFLSFKKRIILLFIYITILFPIIMPIILGVKGFISQTNELLIGGDSLASMVEFRSYLLNTNSMVTIIFFNKWVLTFWNYILNLINFLSVDFFFVKGDIQGHFGVGNFGMFYPVELITISIGIYEIIMKKIRAFYPFLIWILVVVIFVSINKITPHATRSYMMVIPMSVLSSVGLIFLIKKIKIYNKRLVLLSTYLFFMIFFLYSVLFFLHSYFYRFPLLFAKEWRIRDKDLALFLKKESDLYNSIVIDKKVDFVYSSLLFYQEFDPIYFQSNSEYIYDGMLMRVSKLGKYELRDIDWNEDVKKQNTLIISGPGHESENLKLIKNINYKTRPIVIFYDGKLGQYPETKTAYAIYQTITN